MGRQENACVWGLKKKFVIMFIWLAILCCHLVCGGGRWSQHAILMQAKKWKASGDWMMNRKAIWKPGNGKTAKVSRGIAPGPCSGYLQRPIWTPSYKGQHADICWDMAYDHKIQSFMKNGGQQKCLDKALYSVVELPDLFTNGNLCNVDW